MQWRKYIRTETNADGKIVDPAFVGLRNAIAACSPVVAATVTYMKKWGQYASTTTILVGVGVFIFICAVCFGHAFLGAKIGGKKANNLFVILLLIVLILGIWFLTYPTLHPTD